MELSLVPFAVAFLQGFVFTLKPRVILLVQLDGLRERPHTEQNLTPLIERKRLPVSIARLVVCSRIKLRRSGQGRCQSLLQRGRMLLQDSREHSSRSRVRIILINPCALQGSAEFCNDDGHGGVSFLRKMRIHHAPPWVHDAPAGVMEC